MAFALVQFIADGLERDEAVTRRFYQRAIFQITAANTDTALDIGNYSGTFWTAVSGTSPGSVALAAIKDINTRAQCFIAAGGPALAARAPVAASSTVVKNLLSSALAGGAANEVLTVTGLATTDTVIAATMQAPNGTATVAITGWDTQITNSIKAYFTANPGAGGKVMVVFTRTQTTPNAGQYQLAMDGTNTNLPDITFASGDAPTAYYVVLTWALASDQIPVQVFAST